MQNLQKHIEQSVEEFVGRVQQIIGDAVIDAVRQGLQSKTKSVRKKRSAGNRRSSVQVAEMSNALYAAICTDPGQGMAHFADKLGMNSRELALPSRHLLATGKVRKTGDRQHTRYFPISGWWDE